MQKWKLDKRYIRIQIIIDPNNEENQNPVTEVHTYRIIH